MNSRFFSTFNKYENKVIGNLSILLFSIATVIVILEVISRYIFRHSFMWAGETATYLTACSAFLYFGLTEARSDLGSSGHLRVELFISLIKSARIKKILKIISTLIALCYCLIFIWLTIPMIRMFYSNKVSSLSAGYPVWIFYAILCLGLILLAVNLLWVLNKILKAPGPKTN